MGMYELEDKLKSVEAQRETLQARIISSQKDHEQVLKSLHDELKFQKAQYEAQLKASKHLASSQIGRLKQQAETLNARILEVRSQVTAVAKRAADASAELSARYRNR